MRTLFEIVEAVKDDDPTVTYDELKYSLLVYCSMLNVEHRQLREELMRENPQPQFLRDMKLNNSFDMHKTALNTDPKKYLGTEVPENKNYQKMREAGKRIIDKVMD